MGDDARILELPATALAPPHERLPVDELRVRHAIVYRGVARAEDCRRWTEAVYAARGEWTASWGAVQHTLGRGFYTHFEEDQEQGYFDGAADSDARVERALPGLQALLRAFFSSLVGAEVGARAGWCGAGVHVFPSAGHAALHGGDVHFDTEGLDEEDLAARRRSLSIVLMLQAPASGGGLRLWDVAWQGAPESDEMARTPSVVVPARTGDLVLLDSYRLHQIQPFDGARDRVSATLHAIERPAGWVSWF